MALELLDNGTGLPEPLAGVLREAAPENLLTLTLESTHGPLLATTRLMLPSTNNERNLKALPALADEPKNEKRFFFAMSNEHWEVLSAFSLKNQSYFTCLTLDISKKASIPVKSGLFKLADFFTVQCKNQLQLFINDLFQMPSTKKVEHYTFEKRTLEKVISFSPKVQCAVLLDEDGFIIHTEGSTNSVDELGGALARLYYRSNHTITRLECTECNAITLSDPVYTIRIGRLPGTSLALAISVSGHYATAYAHFLHTCAADVLSTYAQRTGQLWGVALAKSPTVNRIRESWFDPPHLIPKGTFVGKMGGKSFHRMTCQILLRTDTEHLQWFNTREEAL